MEIEVLALFRRELTEQIALIEKLLPDFSKDFYNIKNELFRIFHSIKGAASLLKIDSIKAAAGFFEERLDEEEIADVDSLSKGIRAFLALLNDILKVEESAFLEAIKSKEPELSNLEKMFEASVIPRDRIGSISSLNEIMIRFKEHLKSCESQFDDDSQLMILEELATEIKEIGKKSGITILQESGKTLNLCFFAARKKLLGWTRGHFDLITEIVKFLRELSLQSTVMLEDWIEEHKKHIENCLGIIWAIASEATQFVQQDLGKRLDVIIPSPSPSAFDEGGEHFLALFLSELKDQIRDFENDLLYLEKKPDDRKIASKFMRASHSLKGAAKAVEFQALTRLAHSMEDIFSLVQRGEGRITPEAIDVLLNAVDLLNSLSKTEAAHLNLWLTSNKERIEKTVTALNESYNACIEEQEKTPKKIAEIKLEEDLPIKLPHEMAHLPDDKRFLRVSLSHINQLMSVAGEFLVETKMLEIFELSLNKIKAKAEKFARESSKLHEKLLHDTPPQTLVIAQHLQTSVKEHVVEISNLINEFDRYARTSETLSTKFYDEMVQSRMRPFSEGTEFLPRLIRDLCKQLGRKAQLEIQGKDTLVDRLILEKLEAPLSHLVRNAIAHGIEAPFDRIKKGKPEVGIVKVEAAHLAGSLVISVSDDGQGIDLEKVRMTILEKKLTHESIIEKLEDGELLRFLFHPGFSTTKEVTDISGRGIGLNIVLSAVEQLGGKVTISKVREGAGFTLVLPLTLSIIRALIVKMGGEPYAFPLTRIKKVFYLTRDEIIWVEGREYFKDGTENIGLIASAHVLGLSRAEKILERIPVVVISDGLNDYGITVESFLSEREIAIHELDKNFGKMEMISAGSFMEDGTPLLIVDVDGLKRCIDRSISEKGLFFIKEENFSNIKPKKILIVDDSPIVRKVLSYLLSSKGFMCFQANDGQEAYKYLSLEKFDLLITDIDMPNLSGFELIHKLRDDLKDTDTPVIILSYKEEDLVKEFIHGYKVDRFISKNRFQDGPFLEVVKELTTSKEVVP